MSWSWRTKPRSIIKTVEWFPYFAALEGQNWEEKSEEVSRKDQKAVHPVRRTYIYAAHGEEDAWLSGITYEDYLHGQKDQKETESNGRNDKTTFEFFGFGYVDRNGLIRVTEAGRRIVNGTFDQEDYLKQLLKMRVPNYTYEPAKMKKGNFVFPFQVILQAFSHFESLNRSELALLFGCTDTAQIPVAVDAIADFKKQYAGLKNKNDTASVWKLFEHVFVKHYGSQPNRTDSYHSYAEALARTLVYTGLFSASGRSNATKIRVAEHSRMKVQLLQEKYEFVFPETIQSLEDYMAWYGSARNVLLPWENVQDRCSIIRDKLKLLEEKRRHTEYDLSQTDTVPVKEILRQLKAAEEAEDVSQLKRLENLTSSEITSHNEEVFIHYLSKTEQERRNILDKYEDILANDDMSALWLEVNTWKSLIAVRGEQTVKRNFKIEDDLTPKSFAPGMGNTPDMELYKNGYIIVPEVSLMTGVQQWEHEASSVVDHVLGFIKRYEKVQVLGLFLSSRIHVRTMWQFFILNRESWMGTPVPVIPLTIRQYMDILRHIYSNDLEIDDLKLLLDAMAKSTAHCDNYRIWENCIEQSIRLWKEGTL